MLSYKLNAQKDNIGIYYQLVNNAEREICSSSFKKALQLYSESFNYLDGPFTHDLYNAFVCSYLLGKSNYTYYKTIRERGVSKNFFIKTKNIAAKTIDSLEQLGKIFLSINKDYRDSINTMLVHDQLFRKLNDCYTTYADTIRVIDKENASALIDIIKRKGFPSEKMIGNDSNNITHPLFLVLIFHHAHGAKFQSANFSLILDKAVRDGKIDNKLGTYLMDRSDGSDKYGTSEGGICYYYWEGMYANDSLRELDLEKGNHKWYTTSIEKIALVRYNRERSLYFMDTIDDYRKKIAFQIKNPVFDFGLYGYKSTNGMMYKEEFDYLFKNLIELK